MAESTVVNQKFFCHQCSMSIEPKLPDFTCPKCDNGFIEEITEDVDISRPSTSTSALTTQPNLRDPDTQFTELWSRIIDGLESRSSEQDGDAALSRERESDDEEQQGTSHRQQIRFQASRSPYRRTRPIRDQYLHGNIMRLHGNPDDYAWGSNGLDAIITQLLNQIDGCGAPPAEKEKIETLPTVHISELQVENALQCSVCMEDFNLDEEVKRLPCDHHYHCDCIIPWLKMHGTCPVCRKDLNGEDTSLKDSLDPLVDDTNRNNNSSNGMT